VISPQNTPQRKVLVEAVVEAGLISADKLEAAHKLQGSTGKRLDQVLTEQGWVTTEDLARTLSLQLNIPLIDLKRHEVQPQALELVPAELARKHKLVPLDVIADALLLVMADPEDIQALTEVANHTRMKITRSMAIPDEVQRAIELNYKLNREIEEQLRGVAPKAPAARAQPVVELTYKLNREIEEQLRGVTPKASGEEAKAEILMRTVSHAPIVRAVDLLLREAVKDRASDIHIEPQKERLRIRYRIDGILHDVASVSLDFHVSLVSRIKVLAQMDIAERRRPQDGQFSHDVDGRQIDIRVATFNTIYGEMTVLRILDKSLPLFSLSELGLLPQALENYQQMLKSPLGMVVATGPTGAGKTTTLYASVDKLDRDERKIITVEDPVEYQFSDISPSEINPKAEITFASGLRAIMRLDPDVILVGEIRDAETATTAIQAALTGHLVLSSIHANDAVGVIFRLLHFGIEPFVLSSALIGVVAQRMVRRICPHCSALTEAKAEGKIAYQQEMNEVPTHFYYGAGCSYCTGTGYRGRTGVFEVLPITEEIRKLTLTGASSDEIRAQAIKEGMMTMRHDGMTKVKQGITTPYEVLRSVFTIDNRGESEQNRSVDEELRVKEARETMKSPEVLDHVLPANNNVESERNKSIDGELRVKEARETMKSPEVLDHVLPANNNVESERNRSIDGELHDPKMWGAIESLLPDSRSLETYVSEHMPEAAADLVPIRIRNLPELVWATILHLQGKHPKLGSAAQVTLALIEVGLPMLTEMVKGIPTFKALMNRAYLEGDESQRLELLNNQFEVRISASKLNKTVYCMSKERLFHLDEFADGLGLSQPNIAILALVAGMAQSLFWLPGKHQNKALEEIRQFEKWVERRRDIILWVS
jgi:type II secretory ATPase GspE/PulE/Tfp pilus assembly ATPase PilB-like protein